MASTVSARMTAEEFSEWVQRSENCNRWWELERGEVIEVPPPTKPHGVVCQTIGRLLGNYLWDRGEGYVASNDSGVIVERDPDTVRGPDVAVYRDASTFADLHPKYGEVAPVLAVEVLSPEDRINKVILKVQQYLRAGVSLIWLIDTDSRTVTIFRKNHDPAVLQAHQELTGEDVLPGFRCSIADLFRLPGERPAPITPAE